MIVSFAIVAYNEEKTLPRLLEDLCQQDYPHEKIEVLLIDSMSSDNTWNIMQEFAETDNGFMNVRVFKNEKKNIPCGHNVAARNFVGDALVRVDAHATMPAEFVRKNVEVLESGEYASGGRRPNIIDDATSWKKTLLIAEQSMFGSSFASYRRSTEKMYASSLFCPMIRREVFEKVGEYNELLPRSEDNDMGYRIRQAGFKLCYSPDIVYYQHTRNSLKGMLRQKYLNGYWIGKTMGINPKCFSLFHFVPFCFVVAIFVTGILAAFGFGFLSALLWTVYGLFVLINSVIEIITHPFSFTNLLLPVLFFLLHFCYGIGTAVGLIEMPFWVRKVKKDTVAESGRKKVSVCLLKYDMTEKSGGDRVAANLSNALSRYFDVHLVSINGKNEEPYFKVNDDVIYCPLLEGHRRIRSNLIKGARAFRKYVRTNKVDVIFTIGGNVNFFMWYASKGSNIKKVFCEHINLVSALEDRFDSALRSLGVKMADKIVTLTAKDRQSYIEHYSIGESRVESIPNWIEPELFNQDIPYNRTSKKIITVGRLCEQKGLDYLVQVAKIVFSKHKDWHWDIWGDGPDYESVTRDIQKNGLEDNLHLKGSTSDLYSKYPDYSMYAMTSRNEGLPMVLLEAKTRSLPIVSFNCLTGPSEIVEHGKSGYLVVPYNVDEMAERIIELIENEEKRCQFASHAKDNIPRFEKDSIVNRWVSLINDLI